MKYAALLGLLAIGLTAIVASRIHAQTTGPWVEIVNPAEGSTAAGKTTNVTCSWVGSVYKLELYVDGQLADTLSLGKSRTNSLVWKSGRASSGWHVLNVVAYDM